MYHKKRLLGIACIALIGFSIIACDAVGLGGGGSGNGGTGGGNSTGGEEDFIKIISVTPSTNLTDGIEQQFTVKVEYQLSTQEEGELKLFVNEKEMDSYHSGNFVPVHVNKGNGTYTFSETVVPINWELEGGKFGVYVGLYPPALPGDSVEELAYDKMDLSFGDSQGGSIIPEDSDFTYNDISGGVEITEYHGSAKRIIIPEQINGKPVISIGRFSFDNIGLIEVTLPNSIKSLGACAFESNKLYDIYIPPSVTTIGEDAFQYNYLTNVTIPVSVTAIDHYAFADNILTSVTIGKNVTLGDNVFSVDSYNGCFKEVYEAHGRNSGTYTRRSESVSEEWRRQ